MPNPRKILGALDTLALEWGENFPHYVNLNRVLQSQAVLSELRANVEWYISDRYIPGFQFEDDYHAAWFLKTKYPWPEITFYGPIPPEKYDDTWVRMIFVPDRYHYLAEVAACMQKYDRYTEKQIRSFHKIKEQGDEKETARAAKFLSVMRSLKALPPGPLKGERDRMAMSPWNTRIAERFKDFLPPEHATSLARSARKAESYRSERRNSSSPNGWQITNLYFLGTIENPDAKDPEKWEEMTKDYFEHWTWHPIEGIPDPERTKISFREPAAVNLWDRKWVKNKKPFKP